jgi:thiamine-monophosphate kinase
MSPSPAISHIGERALIERIRARAGAPPPWVQLGIGDDAAVLRPARGRVDVITTDSLIEGVHFRRSGRRPRTLATRRSRST